MRYLCLLEWKMDIIEVITGKLILGRVIDSFSMLKIVVAAEIFVNFPNPSEMHYKDHSASRKHNLHSFEKNPQSMAPNSFKNKYHRILLCQEGVLQPECY